MGKYISSKIIEEELESLKNFIPEQYHIDPIIKEEHNEDSSQILVNIFATGKKQRKKIKSELEKLLEKKDIGGIRDLMEENYAIHYSFSIEKHRDSEAHHSKIYGIKIKGYDEIPEEKWGDILPTGLRHGQTDNNISISAELLNFTERILQKYCKKDNTPGIITTTHTSKEGEKLFARNKYIPNLNLEKYIPLNSKYDIEKSGMHKKITP